MAAGLRLLDRATIHRYRLERIRALLRAEGCDAALLYDPINVRYATDTTNMSLWTFHNGVRYAFVATEGPVATFEFSKGEFLDLHSEAVDEIRPGTSYVDFYAGSRAEEVAGRWADEIAVRVAEHGRAERRLAVDRLDLLGVRTLEAWGVSLVDADGLMEEARALSLDDPPVGLWLVAVWGWLVPCRWFCWGGGGCWGVLSRGLWCWRVGGAGSACWLRRAGPAGQMSRGRLRSCCRAAVNAVTQGQLRGRRSLLRRLWLTLRPGIVSSRARTVVAAVSCRRGGGGFAEAGCPSGDVVRERGAGEPGGVGEEAARGAVAQAVGLEVSDGEFDSGVGSVVGVGGFGVEVVSVGDEAVVAPVGPQLRLGAGEAGAAYDAAQLAGQVQAGELMGFDTDMICAYGACVDVSRTWLCGGGRPTPAQHDVWSLAAEQIQRNTELHHPGASVREIVERSWYPSLDNYNCYTVLSHGVGLCDEYPSVFTRERWGRRGYDAVLEPGTVMCVEAFVGPKFGGEGVKLEQQVLITETGNELLSQYPLELI